MLQCTVLLTTPGKGGGSGSPRWSPTMVHAPNLTLPLAHYSLAPAGLGSELERYLSASLAAGTQSNLRTAMKHFDAFIASQPQRPPLQHPRWVGDLEATLHNELTFMLFMVFLVKDGSRLAGTAINYCSLVRNHVAAVSGFPLASSTPRWKKLVRAVRKLHHRERRE